MKNQSFLRHTAIYGVGNVLVHAAGFILLPLYTRALAPSEFGILEILNRIGEVAVVCLLLRGIRNAVMAFHGQAGSAEERARVIATGFTAVALMGALGAGLTLVLTGPLAAFWGIASPNLLALALFAMLLDGMAGVLMVVPQARLESGYFVLLTILQLLLRIILCVVFVTILEWGLWGVLLASLLTSSGLLGVLCFREMTHSRVPPNWRCLWEIIRFTLPFVPAGLGVFLLNNGDRFFLLRYTTAEEVGIYSLGYKMALTVGMFSRTPPFMVWTARMYEVAQRKEAPVIFGRVFTGILACYVYTGMGLCFFQDEVVILLAGARYAGAARVIAPVVLAYLFLAGADLMDSGFYVTRRTGFKVSIALASTVVVCVLYAALIPAYGGMGAALATLGGFAFHAVLTFNLSQRVFPVRYEFGRLAMLLTAACVVTPIAWMFPLELWSVPFKVLLLALTPVLLWLVGFFRDDEAEIGAALRHLLGPVRVWWQSRRAGAIGAAIARQSERGVSTP